MKTASEPTTVQIVVKESERVRALKHLGAAHIPGKLGVLMEAVRKKLHAGQEELPPSVAQEPGVGQAVVEHSTSRLLVKVVRDAWEQLILTQIQDKAFFQLILARIVEPTSMTDSRKIIKKLELTPPQRNTFNAALKRCQGKDYRDQVAKTRHPAFLLPTGRLSFTFTFQGIG